MIDIHVYVNVGSLSILNEYEEEIKSLMNITDTQITLLTIT